MKQKIKIGVVGLGYVGLTFSITLAKEGYQVIGVEKNYDTYLTLKKSKAHFYEENINDDLKKVLNKKKLLISQDLSDLKKCNLIFLTIGTPINKKNRVDLNNLINACKKLRKLLKTGTIIALRSTVKLFTTRKLNKIMNYGGKKFYFAMCPERTIEGSALYEIYKLPQIIGSKDIRSRKILNKVFKNISSRVINFNSFEEAELLKLIDNSYRDVIFGFANELGRISNYFGINVLNVLKNINKDYPRSNISLPGIVGGPCLTKDSHILLESVNSKIHLPIVKSARYTNSNFFLEIINLIKKKNKKCKKILICGLAFKGLPKTSDLRGSMAIPIADHLEKVFGTKPDLLDNLVLKKDVKIHFRNHNFFNTFTDLKLNKVKYDLILILNNSPYWKKINIKNFKKKLTKKGFIYDFWSSFSNLNYYKNFGSGDLI